MPFSRDEWDLRHSKPPFGKFSCIFISDDECKKLTSEPSDPKKNTNVEPNSEPCSDCPEMNCKVTSRCSKEVPIYDVETPQSKYISSISSV